MTYPLTFSYRPLSLRSYDLTLSEVLPLTLIKSSPFYIIYSRLTSQFGMKFRFLDQNSRFLDFRWLFSSNSNQNSVSYQNYKNHKDLEANLRQLSEPPARQNRLSPYPWDYQLIYIKLMNHAYNQWPVSARTMIFL